jgi:hypothetical protein
LKALKEGCLEYNGLPARDTIIGASFEDGQTFAEAVNALLRYRYILINDMTSPYDEGIYNLFMMGVENLERQRQIARKFSTIAEFENFPTLKALFGEMEQPFHRAARFRQTYRARKFREWLFSLTDSKSEVETIREYINECGNRKGIFESNPRKFLKVAGMVALGKVAPLGAAALGADWALATALNSLAPSTVSEILDATTEMVLGTVDSFVIDSLKIGWTPRAYFDGLRRLRNERKT